MQHPFWLLSNAELIESIRTWSLNGFFNEIGRAFLHCLYRERHIGMTHHDDDRQRMSTAPELAKELDAVYTGHARVGYDAAFQTIGCRSQKSRRRLLQTHGQVGSSHKEAKRLTHVKVVIDHMHQITARAVATSSFSMMRKVNRKAVPLSGMRGSLDCSTS